MLFLKTKSPEDESLSSSLRSKEIAKAMWSRTDSGGFHRLLKSAIGVLEEIDLIESFETVFPELKRNNLGWNDEVKIRAVSNLRSKFRAILSELDLCVESMERTLEYVEARESEMHAKLVPLVESRKIILKNINKLSFSKDFNQISFYLIFVGETSEI